MEESYMPVSLDKELHEMNEKELRAAFVLFNAAQANASQSVDYSKPEYFDNVAIYAPAISDGFINTVERLCKEEKAAELNNTPEDNPFFELLKNTEHKFDAEDLKFNNPNSKLFFYPWLLFSGGQGARNETIARKRNWITQKPRDPRIVLIGDSGGFQIQEQTIPFDPKTTPERMLRWLENVADQSMILDFPTGGIETGSIVPHIEKLKEEGVDVDALAKVAGFSTGYMACLIRTQQNNDYFDQNRVLGKTKLLNVIQGRNEEESAHWFNSIKHYPFEGWSFAGKHSVQLSLTLRRLIQMRDEGLLRKGQWIHFLGVSTMKVGVALTYIQRALRKYTDATDVQITFDSKSPVDSVINGYNAISGYDFSSDKWSIHTEPTNIADNIGSDLRLEHIAHKWADEKDARVLAPSTLGKFLTLNDLVGTKRPKTGKRVPSALQQALLINHNTQALIEAFRCAYRFLDEKHFAHRPTSVEFLELYMDLIFKADDPFAVIDEIAIQLDALTFEGHFGK